MRPLDERYPLYPVPAIRSFRDLLRCRTERNPDALALEDLAATPMPTLSGADLTEKVVAFGRALGRLGLAPGAQVALIAENRVQWAVAYLAITTAGMVVVPIDKSLPENELLTILHVSEAQAIVFSEGLRDAVLTRAASLRGLKHLIDMDLPRRDGRVLSMAEMIAGEAAPFTVADLPDPDPDALAVLVFTSGSMGRAKGVMLSQGTITANLVGMLQMIEIGPVDRFLSVLPIHHTYECTCGLLCPLFAGASIHFARSLKTVVEDLQRVRATVLLGVPLLYDKMYRRITAALEEKRALRALVPSLKAAATLGEAVGLEGLRRRVFRKVHQRFGGAIRIFIAGGAAPDPEVSRGLRALGFTFLQGYGLTETSPILALNRLRRFRDDAAGLPLPNVELRIVDADAEGRGEIAARGPSVMLGYYRDPDATAAVMRDGWFLTGDLGFFDADGFLHVCGRKKNVIVARNGKNVYPEELEDLIKRVPYVLECAVYGVRAADGDEEICVAIVPDAEAFLASHPGDDMTPELVEQVIDREIRAINRRLPGWKQVRRIRIRETEFAKTTTQKIKRHLIHEEPEHDPALVP